MRAFEDFCVDHIKNLILESSRQSRQEVQRARKELMESEARREELCVGLAACVVERDQLRRGLEESEEKRAVLVSGLEESSETRVKGLEKLLVRQSQARSNDAAAGLMIVGIVDDVTDDYGCVIV